MMTLDTGGKLLVGTATSIDSASIIQTVGNSQRNISLKYSGTTGGAETLINFVDKRDVINASIGNNLYDDGIGTATAYLVFKTANAGTLAERMRINGAGDVSIVTGNLIIGTAGKGIDFSADGNAAGMTSELLDDYEEGTWTVGLTADTSGTITTNTQTGSYVKIGRQVTVNGFITVASVSAPVGLLRMTGLPFSLSGTRCAVSIWPHSLSAGAVTSVVGFIQNTESSVVLYNYAAGNGAVDMAGQVQAGTNLAVSATYFV
jgi:primosomal replication protein N